MKMLDRPSNASEKRLRSCMTPAVVRRRRVVTASLAGAVLVTVIGVATGSAALLLLDVLLLAPLAGAARRMVRRRWRTCAHDAMAGGVWSAAELADLAPLRAGVGEALPTRSPDKPRTRVPERDRPPLLDRWTVTQVLWAGVGGWLYGRLATLGEALSSSSSPGAVRRQLLRVTSRLIACLGNRVGRTVAVSALATAASTGLLAAGAGAATATSTASWSSSAPATAASISYTVQWGDTLTAIAARYGTTVAAIAAANGIGDPDLIYAGQTLTIPGGSTSAPAPGTAQLTSDVSPASGTGSPATAPATTATLLSTMPATVQATFACIVQHESSGNPEAYNPASQAMGLLQFLESTWLGYGGAAYAPTPLAATPQQQMDVGVLTYEQAGWSPWAGDGCV